MAVIVDSGTPGGGRWLSGHPTRRRHRTSWAAVRAARTRAHIERALEAHERPEMGDPGRRAISLIRSMFRRLYGKPVARNEGRSDMRRIQLASRARPLVKSLGPRLRAVSRDTASMTCAMPKSPCSKGSDTHRSNRSAMRSLRATSCARTVGERSFRGLLISRTHTEIPSHMLRALASSRR
jgi:hypothetical protein